MTRRIPPHTIIALRAMVSLALFVALLTLSGCPGCPCDDLPLVSGSLPVAPGEIVQFSMVYGDDTYEGEQACALHWYVNEIEGGNDELGTISECGVYTAPEVVPSAEVRVIGSESILGVCADCCPASQRQITFAR